MEFSRSTTLLQLINGIGEHPEWLNLTLGAFCEIADANAERSDGLTRDTRLSVFYTAYYKKQVSETNAICESTIRKRELALELWKEIVGDTPLKDITRSVCAEFVRGMRQKTWRKGGSHGKGKTENPYRPATIRNIVRAIESVILAAGPASPKVPHGAGILSTVPGFPPIHVWNDVSAKTPALEELTAILRHCDAAAKMKMDKIYPPETLKEGQEITGDVWWKAFYTFLYNTGLRFGETSRAKWSDLRKMNGRWVLQISVDHEKTHMEKQIPLNRQAQDALCELPRRGDEDLIFGETVRFKLHYWRKKIAKAAGVKLCMSSPHAMRRMVGTYAENAQKVLGHTNAATTRNHYQSIAAVARSLDNLPQPEDLEIENDE